MTDTNTPAKDTSEEDGKNTEGKNEGTGTQTEKPEDADKKFTQADLDRIARKTREEEKRKASEAKAKEDAERAEAKAKEQGEFEKLANDRQAKIEEIEPKLSAVEAERDSLKSMLVDIAKAELKSLPDEVRDISPAEYAEDKTLTNPQAVLAWLPKGKALAEKLNGQSAVKGNGPSPRATGTRNNPDADKQARAQARQAYRE
jgi:hypothetical protein